MILVGLDGVRAGEPAIGYIFELLRVGDVLRWGRVAQDSTHERSNARFFPRLFGVPPLLPRNLYPYSSPRVAAATIHRVELGLLVGCG